jgi:hypothetical protein
VVSYVLYNLCRRSAQLMRERGSQLLQENGQVGRNGLMMLPENWWMPSQ